MPHISYSELKNWVKCPYYHKLVNIDKIEDAFKGNIHTAFGSAVHFTIETILRDNISLSSLSKEESNIEKLFQDNFKEELKNLPEREKLNFEDNKTVSLFEDMFEKGGNLSIMAVKHLHKEFPGFKIVSVEERLMENFEYRDIKRDYKGFIDLAVQTPDGKKHVIDWKTTSWGWDAERKSDKMTTYQLTFYKHFFAKKHNLQNKNIETYFGLIKRTAKKNNIEIFRVPCGDRKINNALNVLNKAVYNIENKKYIKNVLSCSKCELYKTKWCDG